MGGLLCKRKIDSVIPLDALVPQVTITVPKVVFTSHGEVPSLLTASSDSTAREAVQAARSGIDDGVTAIAQRAAGAEEIIVNEIATVTKSITKEDLLVVVPMTYDNAVEAAQISPQPPSSSSASSSSSTAAAAVVNRSNNLKSDETREAVGVSGATLLQETDLRAQIKHVLDMCNDLGISKFRSGSVEVSEVLENLNNYILVDTRHSRERDISMIPNSITISEYIDAVERKKGSSAVFEGKEAVTVCAVGYLSAAYAANIQRRLGMKSRRLNGGILSYVLQGHPLVREGGGATRSLHVFAEELTDLFPLSSGITTVSYREFADDMAVEQEELIAELMKD